jgi:uncharacterized protein (TIGR03067 family)
MKMRLFVLALLLGLPGVPAAADKDPVAKELKRLEGTWVGESGEDNGKRMAADDVRQGKLIFKGQSVIARREGGEDVPGVVTIDPTKDPKTIDLIPVTAEKGQTLAGIYKLEGDTLTICMPMPQKPGWARPTKFDAGRGTNHMLVVLKRQKP